MDLITFFIVIILIFASYTYWRFKDLPPGPYGLPFVGYAPFMGTDVKSRQLALNKLTRKYGKIYSLNLANNLVVIVNDWTTITEVLVKQGNIFSGRPFNFATEFLFERKDLLSADGPAWKEQKKFCMKILQQLRLTRSTMEIVIMDEVENLTVELKHNNGKSMEMSQTFFNPSLNIVWRLIAGKRMDLSDSTTTFQSSVEEMGKLSSQAALLNVLPALRYIIPDLTGYTQLSEAKQTICNYIKQEIDTHNENLQEDSKTNFIDYYLAEIQNKNDAVPYNQEHLILTIFILFVAGTDTISVTLAWSILYMAQYPDIQQKVRQELETVIGKNSYLPMASKNLIPYTEATLLEIQRFATIGPIPVPHCALRDTTIEGFQIPKGTTVFTNLWELHYNEEYWGDPYTFRPERFLDEAGQLKKVTHLLPFSAGPRVCSGEHLAKTSLFLFFTCLMHRFSFQLIPGQAKPSLEPTGGLIASPKPYTLTIHEIK